MISWEFVLSWLKIVVIDLTLGGDNALIIAMAVRALPRRQRRIGIFWGAGAAVAVRVILTFLTFRLLQMPFLQLVGGLLLIWIALKLLREGNSQGVSNFREGTSLREAIWIILIADLIMSTDNILAVAGASQGDLFLLIFGLGLSIPIVVMGASLVAVLMERYGWLLYAGAGVLGEVAAKMMLADNFILRAFGTAPKPLEWSFRVGLALGTVVIGLILSRRTEILTHRRRSRKVR